jgi:hypothetical protein
MRVGSNAGGEASGEHGALGIRREVTVMTQARLGLQHFGEGLASALAHSQKHSAMSVSGNFCSSST